MRSLLLCATLAAFLIHCSGDPAGAIDSHTGAAGTDSSNDGNGDSAAGTLSPYVDFDINHVVITGQSNSVANGAEPPLSTKQPFENVMFDTGVMSMTNCDDEGCRKLEKPTKFVPLVEGDRYFDYPVETAASGMANGIASLSPNGRKHVVLASVDGRSGNTYQCLRKDGCNYKGGYVLAFPQTLAEVEAAKKIAEAAGKSYVVRAVASIHGESDHYSYTAGQTEFPLDGTDGTAGAIATYADGVVEWQRDYDAEIRKITGQEQSVPLFISQISGWNDAVTSKVAQFQLDAHVNAPGKVFLIGPGYALPMASDCLHYTSDGERRLGEYFAKAYARVVFEGKAWEPVRPKSITRSGAEITVVFHVPVPPLVIDTDQVAEAAAYGFTMEGGTVKKVELTGADTVKITLASAPTAKKHLRYAMNQVPDTCIGTPDGARGNIRDSDATPSKNGYPLQNWAVHFDLEVP